MMFTVAGILHLGFPGYSVCVMFCVFSSCDCLRSLNSIHQLVLNVLHSWLALALSFDAPSVFGVASESGQVVYVLI